MKLSDKPSELILQALEDLEWVEAQPEKYVIDMSEWHLPVGGKCEVCMAGSIMARRLGIHHDESVTACSFPLNTGNKLNAINELRLGNISGAFECLELDMPELPDQYDEYWRMSPMSNEPGLREEWKLHMQDLAGILAAEGY